MNAHATRPTVATKFEAQPAPDGLVRRERLLSRLRAGRDKRLAVIQGPAGFGKSTLAAQWQAELRSEGQAVGWLTVDDDDNNPVWLVEHVLAAVNRADTQIEIDELAVMLEQQRDDSVTSVLAALINRLLAYDHPITLVIDDWHLVEAEATVGALDYLLDFAPPNLHVVFTSRMRVQAAARFRVRDQVVEIDSRLLRFDQAEADKFLLDLNALALEPEDLRQLWTTTDGWVAALQLATLSLRDADDVGAVIASFSGRTESIGEYLAETVLDALPSDLLAFLLSTSICDFLSADLAAAVSGRADAWSMLDELRRRNLFLTALDDDGEWFRYHHLFSGYLRRRLDRQYGDEVRGLHRKAARWFAEHDLPSEAVDHALAAGDPDLAVGLVQQRAGAYIEQSRMATLLALVAKLPAAAVAGRTKLQLQVAWAHGLLHRHEQATRTLASARLALDHCDTADKQRLSVKADVVEATIEIYADRIERVPGLIAQILDRPQGHDPFAVAGSANIDSFVHIHTQNFAAVRERQRWARAYHELNSGVFTAVYGACFSGLAAFDTLDLPAADAAYREAVALTAGPTELYARRMAAGLLGRLHYERGGLDAAEQLLEQCYSLGVESGVADFMILTYSTLSRIRALRGDADGAMDLLTEARRVGVELGLARLVFSADYESCRVATTAGDLTAARGVVARNAIEAGPASSADLRPGDGIGLRMWSSRLAMRTALLVADGDAEQAVAVASARLRDVAGAGWPYEEVVARVALAAAEGLQDRTTATATLLPAVVAGARAGLVRTLVDAGPSVLCLLADLRDDQRRGQYPDGAQAVPADYLRQLLVAERPFGTREPTARAAGIRRAVPEAELNAREIDILRRLGQGMSNSEIARGLAITVNTVKWYLKNIYTKVGVTRRGEAVAQARRRGLID